MWQQPELASEFESKDTEDWVRKWLFASNARKTQLVLFDCSNNCGAAVKMNGSNLNEKPSFKMVLSLFSFTFKLD